MEEIWKTIEGYENYKVSNTGYVMNSLTGKILKPGNNGCGYIHVALYYKDHKVKTIMIHRLVAKAFIPNPNNLPQVNHIDECKTNNCVDNLQWMTSEDNINHGTHNKRVGMHNPNHKPIYSVDIDGNVTYFDSARDAQRHYAEKGLDVRPHGIVQVLKKRTYTYKNLAWFYQTDESGLTEYINNFKAQKSGAKRIYTISKDKKEKHFMSIKEAAEYYGLNDSARAYIRAALRKGTEYIDLKWFYEI